MLPKISPTVAFGILTGICFGSAYAIYKVEQYSQELEVSPKEYAKLARGAANGHYYEETLRVIADMLEDDVITRNELVLIKASALNASKNRLKTIGEAAREAF